MTKSEAMQTAAAIRDRVDAECSLLWAATAEARDDAAAHRRAYLTRGRAHQRRTDAELATVPAADRPRVEAALAVLRIAGLRLLQTA